MGASPHTPITIYNGIVREEGLCGRQEMCEHLLPEKLIFSGAGGTGRFHAPSIGCSAVCGKHKLCGHLLPDRLTFSGACGTGRLHIPANRVLLSQGCAFILSPLPSDGVWGGSPMFTESL